jgi:hypothetical protein
LDNHGKNTEKVIKLIFKIIYKDGTK